MGSGDNLDPTNSIFTTLGGQLEECQLEISGAIHVSNTPEGCSTTSWITQIGPVNLGLKSL